MRGSFQRRCNLLMVLNIVDFFFPGKPLQRILALQGVGLPAAGLRVHELDGQAAPGIARGSAVRVLGQAAGQVVRDSRVERAVPALEHVQGPALFLLGCLTFHAGGILMERERDGKNYLTRVKPVPSDNGIDDDCKAKRGRVAPPSMVGYFLTSTFDWFT